MQEGDPSATPWATAPGYPTFVIANSTNNQLNYITTLCCLPEERISCNYTQFITTGAATRDGGCGIGINSTTAASGVVGQGRADGGQFVGTVAAAANVAPNIGINNIYALNTIVNTGCNFQGTQPYMQLTTQYMG